ncbi:hypothetical protein DPMN_060002 [Dreissena polymorpha]|uniref:Uncharacterized protein n=1 Tax=Dreissena polymorpha TaxID=45954 RepID=A0A9D4C4F0_DREPO|nr:hypothetical protein DPMN_060002 [Dreissena polymorpha]
MLKLETCFNTFQNDRALQTQVNQQKFSASALLKAKHDISSLQSVIREKENLVANLTDKLTQISTEFSCLKQNYAKTSDLNLKSNNDFEHLIEKHAKDVEELTIKHADEMTKMEAEMSSKQSDITLLEEKMKKITSENVGLFVYNETLKGTITYARTEYEKTLEEMRDLKEDLNKSKNQIVELKKEVDIKSMACSVSKMASDEIIASLRKEINVVKTKFETKLEEIETNKANVETELTKKSAEMDKLKGDINVLSCANDELIHKLLILEDAEKRLADKSAALDGLVIEKDMLKTDNAALVNEIENLKRDVLQVCDDNQALLDDNAIYKSQLVELEMKLSENAPLHEENHHLRVQNDDLNNKINDQKDVIAELRKELETLTIENVQFRNEAKEFSVSFESLTNENSALRDEGNDLKNCLSEMQKVVSQLTEENVMLRTGHVKLTDSIKQLQKDLESKDDTLLAMSVEPGKNLKSEINQDHLNTMHEDEICELRNEVQKWKTTALEMSAQIIAYSVIKNAQDIVQKDNDTKCDNDNNVFSKTENIVQTEVNDTAYDSLHQGSVVSHDLDSDIEFYVQKIENMELELNTLRDALKDKRLMCEALENQIAVLTWKNNLNFPEIKHSLAAEEFVDAHTTSRLSAVTRDNVSDVPLRKNSEGANYYDNVVIEQSLLKAGRSADENLQVSEVPFPKETLDMEVNLHASSSPSSYGNNCVLLPRSPRFGNVFVGDSVVVSVDDVVSGQDQFQMINEADVSDIGQDFTRTVQGCVSDNDANVNHTFDSNNYAKSKIDNLIDLTNSLEIENMEMAKVIIASRENEEFLRHELLTAKEVGKKFERDHENSVTAMRALDKDLLCLISKLKENEKSIADLRAANEKVSWERDELIGTVNELENKLFEMKTTNSDIIFQKEQYVEELARVKDRLDFLESSDNDIFEIKELLEKLQEERIDIVKENEKLQCSLSAQIDENDRILETLDKINKENTVLLENFKRAEQEVEDLRDDNKSLLEKKKELEAEIEAIKIGNEELEARYLGEIEGLMEENSTLKTSVQIKNTEIEKSTLENQKLHSLISNLKEIEGDTVAMKAQNHDLEKEVKSIANENENLVTELDDIQNKLIEANEQNETLLDKLEEYQKLINEIDEEKTFLAESLESFKVEMKQTLIENQQLLLKKEMQLEVLDQENSTLKTRVLQNSDILDEYNDLQEKIKTLTDDELLLNDKVKVLEKENCLLVTEKEEFESNLTNELVQLTDRCSRLDRELMDQKGIEAYLKEQLKVYEDTSFAHNVKSSDVERMTAQLELEMKYKKKIQNDLEDLQVRYESKQSEVNEMKEEITKTMRDVQSVKSQLEAKEKEIETKADEIDKNKTVIKTLKSETTEHKLKCKAFEDENLALRKEVNEISSSLHYVSLNRDHVRHQVEILSAEIERLMQVGADFEVTCVIKDQRMRSKIDELNKLNIENEVLRQTISELQINLNVIANQLKENKVTAEDFACLTTANYALVKEISQLKEEKKELTQTVESLESRSRGLAALIEENHFQENEQVSHQIEGISAELSNLQEEKSSLESICHKLTDSHSDLKVKYEDLKSELDVMRKDCDWLKSTASQSNKEMQDMQDIKNQLEVENKKNNEVIDQLQKDKSELEECVQKLQSQQKELFGLKNENQKLNNSVSEFNKAHSVMQLKHNQLEQAHETLKIDCDTMHEQLEELEAENERLKNTNDMLKTSIQDNQKALKIDEEILKQNEILSEENSSLTNEVEMLKALNEEQKLTISTFEERLKRIDDLVEQTRSRNDDSMFKRVQELSAKITHIQSEKENLEALTEELTETLHDMQSKYEVVKSEMEVTKRNCDKEIKLLHNQLQEMNDDVTALRRMLDYMESEMNTSSEEKLKLKSKLDGQRNRLDEVMEQKQILEHILNAKQEKDMKNMQVANKNSKNVVNTENTTVQPNNDLALRIVVGDTDLAAQTNEVVTVEQFAEAITAMTETLAELNEAYEIQEESDISDNIPSFQRAFHLLDLKFDECQVSTSVQTNISIGEFDNMGLLIDDTEDTNEHGKDLCTQSCGTQTDLEFADQGIDDLFMTVSENVMRSQSQNSHGDPCFNDDDDEEDNTDENFSSFLTSLKRADLTERYNDNLELKGAAANVDVDEYSDVCSFTEELSVISVDSGILTTAMFDDGRNMMLECSDNDLSSDNESEITVPGESSGDGNETEREMVEATTQTDLADEEKEDLILLAKTEKIREEFLAKMNEQELEIEERFIKKYEEREQVLEEKEMNYERKVQQIEYDLEDKFAQKFRMREIEIMLESEHDKNQVKEEATRDAERKIERIKLEKDRQFMETLQKVRADMEKKYRRSRKRKPSTDGEERSALGLHGDAGATATGNHLHKLQVENQVSYNILIIRAFFSDFVKRPWPPHFVKISHELFKIVKK